MLLHIDICDDEEQDIECIRAYLRTYEIQFNIDFEIKSYTSPHDLLASNKSLRCVCLTFLDIEMPDINGLQLARTIRQSNKNNLIVFMSHYPRYMQDSFPMHPVYYMVKPITYALFTNVMELVMKEVQESQIHKVLVKTNRYEELIPINDILYIESVKEKQNLLRFHLDTQLLEANGLLKDWENKLTAYHFFSTCRGFLLNLTKIHYIKKDAIILCDGTSIPLSRRKAGELHKLLSRQFITTDKTWEASNVADHF